MFLNDFIEGKGTINECSAGGNGSCGSGSVTSHFFIFSIKMKSKICLNCGREMEYRKSWARNWEQVKYCSDKCRREKKSPDYQHAILELLQTRAPGKTICPSEVLSPEDKQNPLLMERVRASARKLVAQDLIEITQRGKVVHELNFKGPIRLQLKKK